MVAKSIIDSRLWIRLDLESSHRKNTQFSENVSNKAHLASQLLLYDNVLIPTKDFGILPGLLTWMDYSTLVEALKSKTLGFVRTSKASSRSQETVHDLGALCLHLRTPWSDNDVSRQISSRLRPG